jgi:Holliday junction DNA helicase RuvA
MIAHLRGTLLATSPGHAIVDCHGVGYDVTVSMNTFAQLPAAGSEVSLFIYTNVREDQIALFGFHQAEEKALFEKLLSVSGIGPKLAVNILGGMSTPDLVAALRGADAARLTRMPGVGKKTAERMVLELKDKLAEFGVAPAAPRSRNRLEDDVLSALINLGYQPAAASQVLEKLAPAHGSSSFEQLFRQALAQLAH